MQFENPVTFVRAIKGAPASILWAFFFNRRVMTALELQEWTGYKGDNITVAVRLLVNLGWLSARSPRGPWCLVEGRQLPLMAESDLIGFSSTTTTTNRKLNLNKSRVEAVAGTNPIKSESQLLLEEMGVPVDANLKACKLYGIGEPIASRISMEKHVTPDFIEAHVRSLVDGETIGLAIVRIRSDETPALWADEIANLNLGEMHEAREALKRGMTLDEFRNLDESEDEDE